MIQIKVSAPGSLSLFGEHAVKYGRIGVKAGIDLRTTLTFKELSTSDNSLQINCPELLLYLEVPVQKFQKFYLDCVKNMESLCDRVLIFTDYTYKPGKHRQIILAFYYLLVYITFKEQIVIKPFTINLSTEFTMNEEFACPASFAVCLATCLLHWSRLQKGSHDNDNSIDMEKMQLYAKRCKEICSKIGMIDVFVCTYGSIIKYKYKPEVIIHSTTLFEIPSMPILLVDSKLQPQNRRAQRKQMQRVAEFINIFPESTNTIFDITDIKTKIAYNAFRELVDVYKDNKLSTAMRNNCVLERHNVIKKCIRTNQIALDILNVTHKRLNTIDSIAEDYGMYGKYTDLGNGRFAYILCLLQTDGSNTCVALLSNELKMHDYIVMETCLARSGVKIEIMTYDNNTLISVVPPASPNESPDSQQDKDKRPYKYNICKVAYSRSTLDIYMRILCHQVRTSKLLDLAASGKLDLGRPLIEQPPLSPNSPPSTPRPQQHMQSATQHSSQTTQDILSQPLHKTSQNTENKECISRTPKATSTTPATTPALSNTPADGLSYLHKLKQPSMQKQDNNNTLISVVPPASPTESPDSQQDQDKKPYKCNICKVACSHGSALDIHMRSLRHQIRASKLQDLAASGKSYLGRPLIEQPPLSPNSPSTTPGQQQHMQSATQYSSPTQDIPSQPRHKTSQNTENKECISRTPEATSIIPATNKLQDLAASSKLDLGRPLIEQSPLSPNSPPSTPGPQQHMQSATQHSSQTTQDILSQPRHKTSQNTENKECISRTPEATSTTPATTPALSNTPADSVSYLHKLRRAAMQEQGNNNTLISVVPPASPTESPDSQKDQDKEPHKCNICEIAYQGSALKHMRSLRHQVRASKLQDLAASSQLDLGRPLIEQPPLSPNSPPQQAAEMNFANPTPGTGGIVSSANGAMALTPQRSLSPGRGPTDYFGGNSNGSKTSGGSSGKHDCTRFTDYQIKVLQKFFENNAYPEDKDLKYLSKLLDLNRRVIVAWFQNARRKLRKARKVYENQPTPPNP